MYSMFLIQTSWCSCSLCRAYLSLSGLTELDFLPKYRPLATVLLANMSNCSPMVYTRGFFRLDGEFSVVWVEVLILFLWLEILLLSLKVISWLRAKFSNVSVLMPGTHRLIFFECCSSSTSLMPVRGSMPISESGVYRFKSMSSVLTCLLSIARLASVPKSSACDTLIEPFVEESFFRRITTLAPTFFLLLVVDG